MNFLFHHIPKSGGRYIAKFFHKGYQIVNGRDVDNKWQDSDLDEIESHIGNHDPTFIITHSLLGDESGWHHLGEGMKGFPEEDCHSCLRKFIAHDNWVVFTSLRDPRDVLCSMYFYVRDGFVNKNDWMINHTPWFSLDITLDEFLSNNAHIRSMPKIWDELEVVMVGNFQNFFVKHGVSYEKRGRVNTSSNKGYDCYCKEEKISEATQKKMNESEDYELFLKIRESQ